MPKPQRGRARQPQNTPANSPAELVHGSAQHPSPAVRLSGPSRRPTYTEAVAHYESGMRALQEHRFPEAAEAFRAVLMQYPEEKELNDRVRLYLALCDRHLRSAPEPKTLEERLYAATLAMNAGDGQTAMRHLAEVVAQDPDHDGALYMLGVAYALSNDREKALSYLQRAIQRNPENRALALQDADLERLMQDESIRSAVDAAAGRPGDMRSAQRHRPIR
jgi:tetratricopeptide (TPR) repeat protein